MKDGHRIVHCRSVCLSSFSEGGPHPWEVEGSLTNLLTPGGRHGERRLFRPVAAPIIDAEDRRTIGRQAAWQPPSPPRPAALRGRAPDPAHPRGDRQHDRHDDRVVRFLPLQHRHRAGLRQALLPQSDPLVGTLQAFAIYAVGFVARPVGAAIFGHYGRPDRPQGGADHDPAADGPCDLCSWPSSRPTSRSASGALSS